MIIWRMMTIIFILIFRHEIHYVCCPGWLNLVGSRILFELNHRKPIIYVVQIQNIIRILSVVQVGYTGTIPHSLLTAFPGAPTNWVQAMVVGCGLSTRGQWDGPVICNEIRQVWWALKSGENCYTILKYSHYIHYLFENTKFKLWK